MVDTDKNNNFNIIFNHFNDLNIYYPSKQYLKERLYDESNDLIQIVDCLRSNNVEHMRHLNQNGIKFGHFKEFNARMAIYYNNVDMLIYLIQSKQINKDLNICLGQLANRQFLKELYQKGLFTYNNTNDSSLAHWYKTLSYLDLDEIIKEAKEFIDFEACGRGSKNYKIQNKRLIGMTFQELST